MHQPSRVGNIGAVWAAMNKRMIAGISGCKFFKRRSTNVTLTGTTLPNGFAQISPRGATKHV